MMRGRISWTGLPEDLLKKIGQCLDTRFDIVRFRSVCRIWRSSLPLPQKNWYFQLPLYTYENPPTILPAGSVSSDDETCPCLGEISSAVLRSTVYILNQYPVPSSVSVPWLLKLEETEQGKLRITNPISDTPVMDFPTAFPSVLNLLDYSSLEVSRGYINKNTLKCKGEEYPTLISTTKVVILPESHRITKDDDFVFLNLCRTGSLLLGRNGEELATRISEDEFHYDDIAVYRGRFVAIDRWGFVSFVDSPSSELIQYTPPIPNGGQMKHLVVSSDHLYAVDRYFDGPRTARFPYNEVDAKVVSFKVYKLDEDLKWTEITSLDDQILFIGEGFNFFVPIKELSGCRGNYIYFMDEKYSYNDEDYKLIGSTGHGIAVFDMVDQRIGKLSSFPGCLDMVWPPPSWFTAN